MHVAVPSYNAEEPRGSLYFELISHPIQNLTIKPRFANITAFIGFLLYAAEES